MLFDRSLYNENKSLKKENKELKEKLMVDQNWLLLEVLNSYMKEKGLYNDFKKYAKSYIVKYSDKNELLDIFKEL